MNETVHTTGGQVMVLDAIVIGSGAAGLVAGNVVDPRGQVVTAAGAGSDADITMTGWQLEQELSYAVARDGGDRR
ncbi:hypothetical protein ACFO5K_19670 [Nocardia halotolerans]|uniref:FAD binding domain-containing protein n=1 Tax=Nocardia halotolerans TaxID=1755878 RepID=A0ABV8VJR2_9NOCA